jgi:hypothetical protein
VELVSLIWAKNPRKVETFGKNDLQEVSYKVLFDFVHFVNTALESKDEENAPRRFSVWTSAILMDCFTLPSKLLTLTQCNQPLGL